MSRGESDRTCHKCNEAAGKSRKCRDIFAVPFGPSPFRFRRIVHGEPLHPATLQQRPAEWICGLLFNLTTMITFKGSCPRKLFTTIPNPGTPHPHQVELRQALEEGKDPHPQDKTDNSQNSNWHVLSQHPF